MTEPEHVWRLTGVTFAEGSFSEYACDLCPAVLFVEPGGEHPVTV